MLSRILLLTTWLPFGYFPLFIEFSNYLWVRGTELLSILLAEAILIALGVIGVYGILSFNKKFYSKEVGLGILIFGIVTSLQTSILATLNITLAFFFWNIWALGEKYAQLNREYNYSTDSDDARDINTAYQKQLQGFFIIGWLIFLGSVLIIFATETLVIDFGTTMTISVFLGAIIILLIILAERLAILPKF
jgi:hypothetical protein